MSRLILAIETSNPSASDHATSVAIGRLHDDATVTDAHAEPLQAVARHADDLMPAIDRLVARAGVTARDLDAIAVSAGPGGYTSLRVAVATAKLIAFAAHAETIAVPTAHALAHRVAQRPLAVALAGKRDSAHVTIFRDDRTDAAIMTEANIPDLNGIGLLIADPFLPAPMRSAAETLGIAIQLPAFDALAVLEAAHGIEPVEPARLLPIYPREPDAVTQWRERHG